MVKVSELNKTKKSFSPNSCYARGRTALDPARAEPLAIRFPIEANYEIH